MFSESINKYSDSVANVFKNEYVTTIIFVAAILYGSLLAPKLPNSAIKIVKHPLFLLVALVVIAFVATKNKKVSIVVGLAMALTLIFVGNNDTANKVEHLTNSSNNKNVEQFNLDNFFKGTIDSLLGRSVSSNVGNVSVARVEGSPVLDNTLLPVTDAYNKHVTDVNGNIVMAPATIAIDTTGNVITNGNKQPLLVPPKVAVTESGQIAKDLNGKVVVAPSIVKKDKTGNVVVDSKGLPMVTSCMVSVDGGNSVRMLEPNRSRRASGGSGLHDDFGMLFDENDTTPEDNHLGKLCVGNKCTDGYEPNCLAPTY
jgi:hypothetical protein